MDTNNDLKQVVESIVKQVEGQQKLTRHVSTLLAFLESVNARFPGSLSVNQIAICMAIAEEVGVASWRSSPAPMERVRASSWPTERTCEHGEHLNKYCRACDYLDVESEED